MTDGLMENDGYDHSILGESQVMMIQFGVGLLLFMAYYAVFLVIDRNHPSPQAKLKPANAHSKNNECISNGTATAISNKAKPSNNRHTLSRSRSTASITTKWSKKEVKTHHNTSHKMDRIKKLKASSKTLKTLKSAPTTNHHQNGRKLMKKKRNKSDAQTVYNAEPWTPTPKRRANHHKNKSKSHSKAKSMSPTGAKSQQNKIKNGAKSKPQTPPKHMKRTCVTVKLKPPSKMMKSKSVIGLKSKSVNGLHDHKHIDGLNGTVHEENKRKKRNKSKKRNKRKSETKKMNDSTSTSPQPKMNETPIKSVHKKHRNNGFETIKAGNKKRHKHKKSKHKSVFSLATKEREKPKKKEHKSETKPPTQTRAQRPPLRIKHMMKAQLKLKPAKSNPICKLTRASSAPQNNAKPQPQPQAVRIKPPFIKSKIAHKVEMKEEEKTQINGHEKNELLLDEDDDKLDPSAPAYLPRSMDVSSRWSSYAGSMDVSSVLSWLSNNNNAANATKLAMVPEHDDVDSTSNASSSTTNTNGYITTNIKPQTPTQPPLHTPKDFNNQFQTLSPSISLQHIQQLQIQRVLQAQRAQLQFNYTHVPQQVQPQQIANNVNLYCTNRVTQPTLSPTPTLLNVAQGVIPGVQPGLYWYHPQIDQSALLIPVQMNQMNPSQSS
eukprot:56855_1